MRICTTLGNTWKHLVILLVRKFVMFFNFLPPFNNISRLKRCSHISEPLKFICFNLLCFNIVIAAICFSMRYKLVSEPNRAVLYIKMKLSTRRIQRRKKYFKWSSVALSVDVRVFLLEVQVGVISAVLNFGKEKATP